MTGSALAAVRARRWMTLAVAVVLLTSCGGDDGAASRSGQDPPRSTTTAPRDAAEGAADEVPAFIGDFDRVCTTQVGFGGVAAYEKAPGIHPVVLFEDFRGEDSFVESSRQLPAGWGVTQDDNFEDSSELEATQLIACSDRTAESPTGIRCEFDDDEAGKVELELVDATYELTVYAAATGEVQHEQTLEAKETTCPFIATFRKGDTTLVDRPSDDEYIAALKPVVAP